MQKLDTLRISDMMVLTSMAAPKPEDKFRALIEDLGKPTLRGVRRCPKCGTLNGTRGISCKNKSCDVVFKEREKKRGHSADAVKIVTGSTVQVYSVRLRDRGPDYRGFVQLPLVQDLDGNPAENVDPIVLESAGRCYVDICKAASSSGHQTCQHIKAAVSCSEDAQPLTLKNSVLNSLQVSSEVKQDIWLLATETSGPLVQRVTKNIMVVKCKPYAKHPLGFLHFAFFETTRNRSTPEYKFHCSCRAFKLKVASAKDEEQKKCVHFYACVCAFASDDKLAEEFSHYINQQNFSWSPPEDSLVTIKDDLASTSESFTDVVVTETLTTEDIAAGDNVSNQVSLKEDPDETEVIIEDGSILPFQSEAKRLKTDILITADSLAHVTSTALLNLQESTVTAIATQPVNVKPVTVATAPPVKKVAFLKASPPKSAIPKKPVVEEQVKDLSFQQWLGSVTERINQTMHYQFDGNPEPLVFHAPQKFFDELQRRISAGSKKKRLPNFTTGFVRKDALPLGTFTKYTWYITSIFHVKQIFDTPEMQLEVVRSFVENRDGTFDLYEAPTPPNERSDPTGKTPIRPFELKTYLKVGLTSPDQKVPTPFVIEWIPDILPKSRIGELRIKFEYGHQRNGQVDHRPSPVTQTEMELQIVHVQPTL
ncbi:hypothetical protein LSH36_74g02076 [Paralvinella palmiformis]|uniref:SWIM-type domain-containing protein n=1 Tax=Paralvinella palmiformis TaxID=53620 RepID=A0AAD9ND26_9ANNE|nr:hypothetical protein LSH36_74g02076 [Paralvinella palmiformis]